MCGRACTTGVLSLGVACGAADALVDKTPDPEWTDADLRAEVGRVLDLMDPASRQAGGVTVATSLALDEELFPSWDEAGRRVLVADALVAEDNRLGCPTRGLAAGVWLPDAGRDGDLSMVVHDGSGVPPIAADGTYQDGTDGPGDSLLFWQDTVDRQGDLEGTHAEPQTDSLAVYSGYWVERESGEGYGRAAGVWHPFRNQPGGLFLAAWTNCWEVEEADPGVGE